MGRSRQNLPPWQPAMIAARKSVRMYGWNGSGRGTASKSENLPSASVVELVSGFVTTTSLSVPGRSAGAEAVRKDALETEVPVAAAPPISADAPPWKPAPVIATPAPPEECPD